MQDCRLLPEDTASHTKWATTQHRQVVVCMTSTVSSQKNTGSARKLCCTRASAIIGIILLVWHTCQTFDSQSHMRGNSIRFVVTATNTRLRSVSVVTRASGVSAEIDGTLYLEHSSVCCKTTGHLIGVVWRVGKLKIAGSLGKMSRISKKSFSYKRQGKSQTRKELHNQVTYQETSPGPRLGSYQLTIYQLTNHKPSDNLRESTVRNDFTISTAYLIKSI